MSDMSQSAKLRVEALGQAPVLDLLLRLSLPASLALLSTALYNIIDTFWVARLGPAAVAGVTLIFPIQLIITAAGSGTGIGLAALVSRLHGQQKSKEVKELAHHILPLTLFLGLPLVLLAFGARSQLLHFLGARTETIKAANDYLGFIALASPALIFSMLASNLLRGEGDTITPMKAMGGAALLNAVADPIFIFGWGAISPMGVRGAALATGASQLLGALYLLWQVRKQVFGFLLEKATLSEIYKVGLPAAFATVILTLVVGFHNRVLAPFGALPLGAYGILFRLYALVFMPSYGICQGLLPIVGHAVGAGQNERLKKAINRAVLLAATWGAIAGGIVIVGAEFIVSLFGGGDQLTIEGSRALRLAGLGWIAAGPQLVWVTALHGMGRGGASLFVLFLKTLGLLIPLVLLLSKSYGPTGVWLAQPLAEFGGFLIAWFVVWRVS